MERLFLLSPSYRRNFIDKLIFSENKSYNKQLILLKNIFWKEVNYFKWAKL